MVEALGNIKFGAEKYLTKEQFQEVYYDELMELVSDSDNMVRIKAFQAVAKLLHSDEDPREILEEKQIENEILPAFLRLIETVIEDEDGMQMISLIFGKFVHSVHKKTQNLVFKNASKLC